MPSPELLPLLALLVLLSGNDPLAKPQLLLPLLPPVVPFALALLDGASDATASGGAADGGDGVSRTALPCAAAAGGGARPCRSRRPSGGAGITAALQGGLGCRIPWHCTGWLGGRWLYGTWLYGTCCWAGADAEPLGSGPPKLMSQYGICQLVRMASCDRVQAVQYGGGVFRRYQCVTAQWHVVRTAYG